MFLENELPQNWVLLSAVEANAMEVEIAREMCGTHPLHGKPLNAVAKKVDTDDFLYSVSSGDKNLYLVHLTWNQETRADWPSVKVFSGKRSFLHYVCRPDAKY